VFDIILSRFHSPRLFTRQSEDEDVDVVRIESDINFLTATRVKDFIVALTLKPPELPSTSNRQE